MKSPFILEGYKMNDKGKKIGAFRKLVKMAQEGSVKLYTYTDDPQKGGKYWPVNWEDGLKQAHFKNAQERQKALDRSLACLLDADLPDSVEHMDQERGLARLLLDAGANPNAYNTFYAQYILDAFVEKGKTYVALEIAKTDGFSKTEDIDSVFKRLTESEDIYPDGRGLNLQDCNDRDDLIFTLFEKGHYPMDDKVFVETEEVVLGIDPHFFDKKKAQQLSSLEKAHTPLQIYKALKRTGKE